MLEETVHNTDDADIFADTFQTRDQRAHAADQQINRHAGAGGGIQSVHQTFIHQVVQLQRNPGRLPVLRIGDLAIDHLIQQTTRVLRRHQQVVEANRTIGVLDKVKHPADFIGNARIGG